MHWDRRHKIRIGDLCRERSMINRYAFCEEGGTRNRLKARSVRR